jgi:hypothetical protein
MTLTENDARKLEYETIKMPSGVTLKNLTSNTKSLFGKMESEEVNGVIDEPFMF